jgi:hypothetical protein
MQFTFARFKTHSKVRSQSRGFCFGFSAKEVDLGRTVANRFIEEMVAAIGRQSVFGGSCCFCCLHSVRWK